MKELQRVYLGIKAHVVCLEMATGKEVWRTQVKRSQIISVFVEDDLVVAHAGGELFGLDKGSGQVLWKNGLSGLGYGYCFMATESGNSSAQMHNTVAAIRSNDDAGSVDAGD